MLQPRKVRFLATDRHEVGGLILRPRGAIACLVLGHGAGAGMGHPFMEAAAQGLAERKIATFRYQFPYMESGRRAPDSPKVLLATIRNAVVKARRSVRGLPLFAGGKSMGGRMTTLAAAQEPLDGVKGLVFHGFPLHAPAKRGNERAAHLVNLKIPMLFVQGTRDKLCDLELLAPVLKALGRRAKLHLVDGADHGFHVPKRSGRTDAEALAELVHVTAAWVRKKV